MVLIFSLCHKFAKKTGITQWLKTKYVNLKRCAIPPPHRLPPSLSPPLPGLASFFMWPTGSTHLIVSKLLRRTVQRGKSKFSKLQAKLASSRGGNGGAILTMRGEGMEEQYGQWEGREWRNNTEMWWRERRSDIEGGWNGGATLMKRCDREGKEEWHWQ